MQFRDLQSQYHTLKEDIDAAVSNVLSAGRFIGGEPVAELERQLAEYVGVRHCVTCANGTDALQLALMVWGIGPGDAVFVPDFTFFSSGEVVSAVGAMPVFVDVDERTFNISAGSLERAVAFVEREGRFVPKAVVAVDLFGQPADYPALRPICEEHGLLLLEDGAQGFGGGIACAEVCAEACAEAGTEAGTEAGAIRRACSFGDISTTSFFPAKPLGCYGDGGAVFTDSDEWAALIRSYAVHGKGSMKYDNVRIGMNSRLDTLQAAILQVKLRAFAEYEVENVNRVAVRYNEELAGRGLILPYVQEGFSSSWAQYTVRLPQNADRAGIQAALKEQGIPTMVYYPKPMHEQLAFAGACSYPDGCPVTQGHCASVLALPMGPYMEDEFTRVSSVLLQTVARFTA